MKTNSELLPFHILHPTFHFGCPLFPRVRWGLCLLASTPVTQPQALKERNPIAQGAALGTGAPRSASPERAESIRRPNRDLALSGLCDLLASTTQGGALGYPITAFQADVQLGKPSTPFNAHTVWSMRCSKFSMSPSRVASRIDGNCYTGRMQSSVTSSAGRG